MSDYNPDCWVIVRFTSEKFGVVDKILAGWSGGYTSGSEWKLNSGITKVEDKGDRFLVTGSTGSVYNLYKPFQKLGSSIAPIYHSFVKQIEESSSEASIEILDSFEAC